MAAMGATLAASRRLQHRQLCAESDHPLCREHWPASLRSLALGQACSPSQVLRGRAFAEPK
jgi:hypothetical protein